MKIRVATLTMLSLCMAHSARADQPAAAAAAASASDLGSVAPALQRYGENVLEGDLWKRPDLTPRDRSIVAVSALAAAGQTGALRAELNRALDNGVKPAELGAIMTHLAFYAGWPNALSD